jgi:isopenicillin-N N-acyltransferase like protein
VSAGVTGTAKQDPGRDRPSPADNGGAGEIPVGLLVHRSQGDDPYERGRAFGEAKATAVASTILAYRRLFSFVGFEQTETLEYGRRLHRYLSSTDADAVAEIEGIAAGAGELPTELLAVNARTEILSFRAPECSTIAVLPPATADGGLLLAQNWDWHPDLRSSRVVWRVELGTRWLITFTEAGIVGKIGLNGDGLGVCLNAMRTTHDRPDVGLPIHVLLRRILQDCSTLAEAEAMVVDAHTSASASVTIGGVSNGEAGVVCAEITPGGATMIRPRGDRFVHTNHFLAPPRSGDDAVIGAWPDTTVRYEELTTRLDRLDRPIGAATVQELLRAHGAGERSVCCHAGSAAIYEDRCETLASIVMNLGSGRLFVTDGTPCSAEYRPFHDADTGSDGGARVARWQASRTLSPG